MTAKTNISLDWITATVAPTAARPGPGAAAAIATKLGQHELGPAKPFPNNYTQAIAVDYGRLSWHDDRPELKICFNASGADCKRIYAGGALASDLVGRLYDLEANFTRLDLALDYHGEADIGLLVSAYEADPSWALARTIRPFRQITAAAEGVTSRWSGVYLGSQASHRYICVYDKRLQLGLDGPPWVRVELRTRHEYASTLAGVIAVNGLDAPARGMINQVARPPVDWWAAALDGEAVESPAVGRPDTDTDRWLLDTVLPVLKRRLEAAQDAQDAVYRAYHDTLVEAQAALVNRGQKRTGGPVDRPIVGSYAFKRR